MKFSTVGALEVKIFINFQLANNYVLTEPHPTLNLGILCRKLNHQDSILTRMCVCVFVFVFASFPTHQMRLPHQSPSGKMIIHPHLPSHCVCVCFQVGPPLPKTEASSCLLGNEPLSRLGGPTHVFPVHKLSSHFHGCTTP